MFSDLISFLLFLKLFDSVFEVDEILNLDNTVKSLIIDVSNLSLRVDKFLQRRNECVLIGGLRVKYLFVDGTNSVQVLETV